MLIKCLWPKKKNRLTQTFKFFSFIFINIIMDGGLAALLENIIWSKHRQHITNLLDSGFSLCLCCQQQKLSKTLYWNERHMAQNRRQYIIILRRLEFIPNALVFNKKQIFCKYSISRESEQVRERERKWNVFITQTNVIIM